MAVNPKPDSAPPWEENRLSIKYYVKRFILAHRERFAGKVVIDAPAGSGITARILREAGAEVRPFDLFPEYFKTEGLTCARADLNESLPVEDEAADYVICQEGIEHLSDQLRTLEEFNRVLKPGGSLILTTPNYSNLHSRLSYLLFETEYFPKKMPANEIDAVWMMNEAAGGKIYLGHYFLLGIQRLRGLARLAGFRVEKTYATRLSTASLVLLPLGFPLLWLASWMTYWHYRRRFRRNPNLSRDTPYPPEREQVFRELMRLNTDRHVLLDRHLFVELVKEGDVATSRAGWESQHRSFDVIP